MPGYQAQTVQSAFVSSIFLWLLCIIARRKWKAFASHSEDTLYNEPIKITNFESHTHTHIIYNRIWAMRTKKEAMYVSVWVWKRLRACVRDGSVFVWWKKMGSSCTRKMTSFVFPVIKIYIGFPVRIHLPYLTFSFYTSTITKFTVKKNPIFVTICMKIHSFTFQMQPLQNRCISANIKNIKWTESAFIFGGIASYCTETSNFLINCPVI